MVQVELDGRTITMEVDNSATCTTMSSGTYACLWPPRSPFAPGYRPELQPVEILMQPYPNAPLTPALGARAVRVRFKSREANLPVVVVEGPGAPPHSARSWAGIGFLPWEYTSRDSTLSAQRHPGRHSTPPSPQSATRAARPIHGSTRQARLG